MTTERGVEEMPIWQNHENRITTIEVNQDNISQQMNGLERVVKDESKEQKALLNKLIEHHLDTNKMKLSSFWKLVLNITGAGGLFMALVYAVVQFFNLK